MDCVAQSKYEPQTWQREPSCLRLANLQLTCVAFIQLAVRTCIKNQEEEVEVEEEGAEGEGEEARF